MSVGWRIIFICLLLLVLFSRFALPQSHSNWQIEVVDKAVSQGAAAFSSLVIDQSGTLHLAYANRSGSELRYSFRSRDSKRWVTVTVDENGGAFNSLAIDARGWPHIAYNSFSSSGLHYAEWDGKQWQKLMIDPASTGHQTSIQWILKGILESVTTVRSTRIIAVPEI